MRYTVLHNDLSHPLIHERYEIIDSDTDKMIGVAYDKSMALHIAALLNLDEETNDQLRQAGSEHGQKE